MKMASVTGAKVIWLIFAIVAMGLSGYFLYLAQKQIPIGTAYAVSPSNNEVNATVESVGISINNTTLKTSVTKKMSLNDEKAIQSNVSPEK